MKRSTFLPRFIAVIVALAGIASMFLPYISMTPEYEKKLQGHLDERVYKSVDFTVGDTVDITLFEYAKVYYQGAEELFRKESTGIGYAIAFAAPGIFCLFALLCALCRKATPLIIQALLLCGMIYSVNWDVIDRGIMPSSRMTWGISHLIYYPIAAVLFICGIWLFIVKHRIKKAKKRSMA